MKEVLEIFEIFYLITLLFSRFTSKNGIKINLEKQALVNSLFSSLGRNVQLTKIDPLSKLKPLPTPCQKI